MQNVPGATFNACFYTLLSKLWPSGEIPSNIIEDDDTARLFLDKTFDAIAFLSKITVPEAYRSLYMKSYKDSFGAFLYIPNFTIILYKLVTLLVYPAPFNFTHNTTNPVFLLLAL